jgi:hypothetical protein
VLAGPLAIVGPILDTVSISHNVEGTSFEELGRCINSCLLHLFTTHVRVRHCASSVVTPRGYKASCHPYAQPISSRMISYRLPASFPTLLKIKRDGEADLEIGESC